MLEKGFDEFNTKTPKKIQNFGCFSSMYSTQYSISGLYPLLYLFPLDLCCVLFSSAFSSQIQAPSPFPPLHTSLEHLSPWKRSYSISLWYFFNYYYIFFSIQCAHETIGRFLIESYTWFWRRSDFRLSILFPVEKIWKDCYLSSYKLYILRP